MPSPEYRTDDPVTSTSPRTHCLCGCGALLTGRQVAWATNACRQRKGRYKGTSGRVRNAKTRRYIGIDGESVDNRYVLLAAASDDGWSEYIEPRRGESELRTADCLHFIASLPDGIVWGFSFSYDVNMILHELAPVTVRRLYETGRCRWRQYSIEYVPKKMLRVIERDGSRRDAKKVDGSVVWDMFPWQQTSFATWLEDESLADPKDIARIREMKHKRATFSASERRAIIRYCLSECQYLAKGARRLVETIALGGFTTGGKFFSPASLAKAKMKSEGVKRYMADPPPHLVHAIETARFGGRAEVGQSGPIEQTVWQHDINSAYPTELASLPCLACGTWEHDTEATIGRQTLCRVRWKPLPGHRPVWGPFPMRGQLGSLRFPSSGEGWYWGAEVLAAERHANITVLDTWTFKRGCAHKPFAYVPEMYKVRKAMKADGNPAEYVLKLALNSTYGALAERPHRHQRGVPPWRSLMWAGMITAGTRAKMLDVLNDSVVMIATDGIFATERLEVDEGKGLGQWEVEKYDSMWIAGTGFYFPRRGGEWMKPKTRGFSAYDIDRDRLIETWRTDGREGKYTDTRRRFIGMGTALHRIGGMWPPYERLWRQFIDEPVTKTFNLFPRRTWITSDIHDGRSRAPSLEQHKQLSRADVKELAELRQRVERERAKLQRAIKLAESRGIPWQHSPRMQGRLRNLLLLAHALDVREHGVDGASTLPRSDQPMGEGHA